MTKTPASDRKVGMDALSDVLRVAHLTGGVFLHADFFAPWCMAARVGPEHCAPALGPASQLILYHYVVEGEFRIRRSRMDPLDLPICCRGGRGWAPRFGDSASEAVGAVVRCSRATLR